MNGTAAGAHRALVTASGFVLDVPLLGPAEAADRVLRHWQDGAALRELPCGSWLLHLTEPVPVRADRAPGLPLLAHGRTLVALDTTDETAGSGTAEAEAAEGGLLLRRRGGVLERHSLAALPRLNPAEWLDHSALTIHRLRPLDTALEPQPVVEAVPESPRPDLRAAAGVRPASDRVRRALAREPRPGGPAVALGAARMLLPLTPALLLLGRFFWLTTTIGPGAAAPLLMLVAVFALIGAVFGRPAPASAGGGSAPARTATRSRGRSRARRPRWAPLAGLFAALALRTPASRLVRGRHARYLCELSRAFHQRRWEDALRDAVALGRGRRATAEGWLSLALPRRRTGALRADPHRTPGGRTSPVSAPTVHQHLSELYRQAAEALEAEGRIDEAAFVLADLLDAPAEAVALLARHGRHRAAAELAEGRGLDPELLVRLWWQAGDRDRAVRIAQWHGVFAAAVRKLQDTGQDAARELRTAWVRSRQAAGDRIGAVEAAWPDERLWPLIAGDLRDGVALGGPTRARSLAHLLALGAGKECAPLALAILDDRRPESGTERARLAAALARVPGSDPALDRRITTAAVRALVRDHGFGPDVDAGTGRELFDALLKRADPLAAADLRPPRPSPTATGRQLTVGADPEPGRLPVLDAVALASGSVLVACGHAGVRLLAADGRTRARWATPADRLVFADHGGTALLVASYGETSEIARLDLATRQVRPWTTLRGHTLPSSFDGRLLTTVDEEGIAVLDTLADRPSVVWRELGHGSHLLGPLARTPGSCSAVVASLPLVERWRWDMPGWQLRSRLPLEHAEQADAVLADGTMLTLTPDGTELVRHGEQPRTHRAVPGGPDSALLTDGDLYAVVSATPDGAATLSVGPGSTPIPPARLHFPDADPAGLGLRHHGSTATVWHRDGRLVALTSDATRLLANLRLTAG